MYGCRVKVDDVNERVLIVAPWGDPSKYNKTKYIIKGIEVEAHTSIKALAQKYINLKPKIMIVIQETLLAPSNPERFKYTLGVDPVLVSEANNKEKYIKLLNKLRELIREVSEKWIEIPKSCIEVIIAPGVGNFKIYQKKNKLDEYWRGIWIFRAGTPFDYYASVVMLGILNQMLNLNNKIKLVVDLTHGMNYTGTALYRAAIAAARLYSVFTHNEVKLEIYNSEPYSDSNMPLNIWKIRSERIKPKSAASRLVYMMLSHDKGKKITAVLEDIFDGPGKDSTLGKLNKLFEREIHRVVVLSAASVLGGFPLLFLQAGLESNINLNKINKIRDYILGYEGIDRRDIEVKECEYCTRIYYNNSLSFRNLKSLLAGLALVSYVAKAYNKISKCDIIEEKCCECQGERERVLARLYSDFEQGVLKEVVDKFTATPMKHIAEYELAQLDKCMRGKCERSENYLYRRIHYAIKYKKEFKIQENYLNKSVGIRNFVAHAGLTMETVDVMYIYDNVYIAYNCKKLENIHNIATEFLRKTREAVFL